MSVSGDIPLLEVCESCRKRPLERGSALAACFVGSKVGVLGLERRVVEDDIELIGQSEQRKRLLSASLALRQIVETFLNGLGQRLLPEWFRQPREPVDGSSLQLGIAGGEHHRQLRPMPMQFLRQL